MNNTALALDTLAAGRLDKLRELLALVAALRDLREPLTSPAGLRQAVTLLLRLAELSGVDRAWTNRLRAILDDPLVFDVVLAIVRYLAGMIDRNPPNTPAAAESSTDTPAPADSPPFAAGALAPESEELAAWLPLSLQIVHVVHQIRGAL